MGDVADAAAGPPVYQEKMSRALLLVVICIIMALSAVDALKCFKCTGPGCSNPEKIQSVPCMSHEKTCLKELKSNDLIDRGCTNTTTCEKLKEKSGDLVHSCSEDDCNGALNVQWTSVLLLLAPSLCLLL